MSAAALNTESGVESLVWRGHVMEFSETDHSETKPRPLDKRTDASTNARTSFSKASTRTPARTTVDDERTTVYL